MSHVEFVFLQRLCLFLQRKQSQFSELDSAQALSILRLPSTCCCEFSNCPNIPNLTLGFCMEKTVQPVLGACPDIVAVLAPKGIMRCRKVRAGSNLNNI